MSGDCAAVPKKFRTEEDMHRWTCMTRCKEEGSKSAKEVHTFGSLSF